LESLHQYNYHKKKQVRRRIFHLKARSEKQNEDLGFRIPEKALLYKNLN